MHGIEGDYGNFDISVLKGLSMLHAQNNIINLKVVWRTDPKLRIRDMCFVGSLESAARLMENS